MTEEVVKLNRVSDRRIWLIDSRLLGRISKISCTNRKGLTLDYSRFKFTGSHLILAGVNANLKLSPYQVQRGDVKSIIFINYDNSRLVIDADSLGDYTATPSQILDQDFIKDKKSNYSRRYNV